MYLYRLILNRRSHQARRDLANPYDLHSTLCRAFSPPDTKCPPGTFLWRQENQQLDNRAIVLVQSSIRADWSRIGCSEWFESPPKEPLSLVQQLALDTLEIGKRFRFRLRANPSTSCQGKRQGLLKLIDQEQWLVRKGTLHGFELPTATSFGFENNAVDIIVSQSQMLRSCQRNGCPITIFSAQYDGILAVTDIEKFCTALETGIGHGKMMGLGLLSVVPLR